MGEHGTREQEVDDFLRQEVLVDLYRVVKQALRASIESYSIKAIETLYGFERTAEVDGRRRVDRRASRSGSRRGDDALLDEIERYNEEDCRSTVALHEWLLSIRPRGVPWRDCRPTDASPPRRRRSATRSARRSRQRLLDGRRGGRAASAPRAPRRLPPARGSGRSGGSGSAGRSSTTTS